MQVVLLLLLLFQGLSGVTGRISDPTGAVIPGVEITVTNTATGVSRGAISNETGAYVITQLPPGRYSVRAELRGFKAKVVSNIPFPVNETVTLDLQLEVGVVTDVVEVIATSETVNTVDAKLGVGFDQKKIIDLPLNARNIVGLLALQTGVTMSDKNVNDLDQRDSGGQVNGARNDQQNIVLDGVNINAQERGSALEGALPTTLDSVQEFIVQTAGYDGGGGRGSGAQIQLVTKSGSNAWHGSAYEYYRTTHTSAKNYFASDRTHLLRHLPGGSVGGPFKKDKLFFFGAYERHTDRSATLEDRNVPTPEFLNGNVRYQRRDLTFATITDGPGGMLEKITLIPGDRWNPNVIGPNGIFEKYRPFSTDTARTRAGSDNGANILVYRFNAPFVRDRNVYISRLDFNLNSKNSLYWRGTLNDDSRTLSAERFPGFENPRQRQDNSKGFAANWNNVISPNLNSNFSAGLTRESFGDTGNQQPYFSPNSYGNPLQTTGAVRQAINTWNFVENVSWIKGSHNLQFGGNYRFIDNTLVSFDAVEPQVFTNPSNLTGNEIGVASMPALRRALGDAEFAQVRSPGPTVGDALMNATGSASLLRYDLQFDTKGNVIPAGNPLARNYGMHEWDYFVQDTWRPKANLTLAFGVNYQLQTPPYERNGVQVNWTQDLGQRWKTQMDTDKLISQLPILEARPAGRANKLPDYYKMDTNNWAPRASFAWTVSSGSWLGGLTKGGSLVVRGGYSFTYDRIGGRLSRDAALVGSVGLKTRIGTAGYSYSLDGANGISRAGRIGPGGALPFSSFPAASPAQDFRLPQTTGGLGGVTTAGIDPSLHASPNQLLNLTISKEMPGGWLVEASYVGRFARDLLGQVDLASPLNYRDPKSGLTYYDAVKQLVETYEHTGAAASVVQPIAWFENVLPELRALLSTGGVLSLGQTFANSTQAFYAYMNQGVTPGRNAAFDIVDHIQLYEAKIGPRLLNTQAQFIGLWTNLSRSNYNSAQVSVRKRFGQGYTMTVNYTFGKSLDTTSAAEALGNRATGGLAIDPYRPNLAYGLSNFDRRHQLNANALVELPFGRGKMIGRNVPNAVNHLIGGWQLSGILVTSTGRPFSFGSGNRFNLHYFGQDEPFLIKPIDFKLTKANGRVYNIPGDGAARQKIALENFQTLYPGGPIPRNQGRGPNFSNVDLAVTKTITVKESIRTRLRAEAFNAFNHPNFSTPSRTNIDGAAGTLGEITSTIGTERVMQFSIRIEF